MSNLFAIDRDLEKKAPADDGAETAGTEESEETRLPTRPDESPKKNATEPGEDEEEGEEEDDEDEDEEGEGSEGDASESSSAQTTSDQEQQQPRHET